MFLSICDVGRHRIVAEWISNVTQWRVNGTENADSALLNRF